MLVKKMVLIKILIKEIYFYFYILKKLMKRVQIRKMI